jgi:uncharacterized protein (DUF927 family)
MAGQSVRVVDIPADAGAGSGAFENLHEFGDGKAISEHLNRAALAYYGLPFRRYLELLTTDREHFKEKASVWLNRFEAEACSPNADGQVKRVATRFGLVATAGELATEMGILPWPPGNALWAAKKCFKDWIYERGGIEAAEAREAIVKVQEFIMCHGASRFENPDGSGERLNNRAGYRKQTGESIEYWIEPGIFRKEICAGGHPKMVCCHLLERGHLILGEHGKHSKVQYLSKEKTRARFYTVKSTILSESFGS